MAVINRAEAESILGRHGWLALQLESFRAEVLHRAILLHFAPGEVIYRFGDPLGGIYGLASGIITVNTAPPTEAPRLVHVGAPGFWTGEACFLTRQPRRVELRAVAETSMLHLPLEAMDQMAARDPSVVRCVAQMLMMNVDTLIQIIHDLQKPDAARRIASVLQRTTRIGAKQIPLSQTALGVMANASRKQVNAALQRFAAAGWIENTYRSVTVTDLEGLRRFAMGDGAD